MGWHGAHMILAMPMWLYLQVVSSVFAPKDGNFRLSRRLQTQFSAPNVDGCALMFTFTNNS